jgi:hypothetical protein
VILPEGKGSGQANQHCTTDLAAYFGGDIMVQFSVDPWPRIEFYVRHGLVQKMPTARQLKQVSKLNVYVGGGMTERLRYYVRHPLDLFPTPAKIQALQRMRVRSAKDTTEAEETQQSGTLLVHQSCNNNTHAPEPFSDRLLKTTCQFSPLRFAIACYFNPYGWSVPWDPVTGTGLTMPLKPLISHVLHTPHELALWDLQIIHADEGGLDQLERELELAVTNRRLKYRFYRAMVQDLSYYDHLHNLIPRVRRFDYPPPPPTYGALTINLVVFLNHALTL